MQDRMFHVFRNSPLGRENLLQAAYFCRRQFDLSLAVFIPQHVRFVMQFANEEVTVDLDRSYTRYGETAQAHADAILEEIEVDYTYFTPTDLADTNLPIIPVDWGLMSCPRVISEQTGRVGLGHIGPKVRRIAKGAPFPVFIPALAFKPWHQVAIFFGGSELGAMAVREGIAIARLARVPFRVFTHGDEAARAECEQRLTEAGLLEHVRAGDGGWTFWEGGTLEEHLFDVPHDALAVVGAAGHRLMAELLFGSKLETIQTELPNPLVVIGPNCRPRPQLDTTAPRQG